jgi:hypothetical protein
MRDPGKIPNGCSRWMRPFGTDPVSAFLVNYRHIFTTTWLRFFLLPIFLSNCKLSFGSPPTRKLRYVPMTFDTLVFLSPFPWLDSFFIDKTSPLLDGIRIFIRSLLLLIILPRQKERIRRRHLFAGSGGPPHKKTFDKGREIHQHNLHTFTLFSGKPPILHWDCNDDSSEHGRTTVHDRIH